jgi:F-type H+-transporting ATPase subunit b
MDFILSVLQSIGFNSHVALANFVNFLIVLFILNKFIFKKVIKTIDERDEIIKKGLTDASTAEANLKSANTLSAEIIAEAKNKAELDIKTKIDHANEEANRIISESKADIKNLENTLNSKIESAKKDVENDFAKIAPELLVKMFKDTLGKNLDPKTNDILVSGLIK